MSTQFVCPVFAITHTEFGSEYSYVATLHFTDESKAYDVQSAFNSSEEYAMLVHPVVDSAPSK